MSSSSIQSDEEASGPPGPERFAEVIVALEGELDWPLLGQLYCHEGGECFFDGEAIEAMRDAGLRLASDLAEALEGTRGKRSLYVGAAVAELIPALMEVLVLGRRVTLVNLPGPEAEELNRALAVVAKSTSLFLPRVRTGELAQLAPSLGGPFGHLWMTSVLSDPERFPGLHDRLYGRGSFSTREGKRSRRDLQDARELVSESLALLRAPALCTTTDEELEVIPGVARERGLHVQIPDHARLSAIVGDPVRHCRLLRS